MLKAKAHDRDSRFRQGHHNICHRRVNNFIYKLKQNLKQNYQTTTTCVVTSASSVLKSLFNKSLIDNHVLKARRVSLFSLRISIINHIHVIVLLHHVHEKYRCIILFFLDIYSCQKLTTSYHSLALKQDNNEKRSTNDFIIMIVVGPTKKEKILFIFFYSILNLMAYSFIYINDNLPVLQIIILTFSTLN